MPSWAPRKPLALENLTARGFRLEGLPLQLLKGRPEPDLGNRRAMSWVTKALLAWKRTRVASQGQTASSWLAVVLAFYITFIIILYYINNNIIIIYITFTRTWKHLSLEGHSPLSFQAVVSWLEPEWRGSRWGNRKVPWREAWAVALGCSQSGFFCPDLGKVTGFSSLAFGSCS